MLARLSVLALYEYDSTLFDLLTVPEKYIVKEALIDKILSESAELAAVYPNAEMCKAKIGNWSVRRQYNWTELAKTMGYEYDPIYNYNRMETETVSRKQNENGMENNKMNESNAMTTNSGIEEEGTSTTSNTAFNSESFQPVQKVSNSNERSENSTVNGTNIQNADTTTANNINEDINRTVETKGNIGVTTTQKLISEQRELATFDLYDVIVNEFIEEFCVHCY